MRNETRDLVDSGSTAVANRFMNPHIAVEKRLDVKDYPVSSRRKAFAFAPAAAADVNVAEAALIKGASADQPLSKPVTADRGRPLAQLAVAVALLVCLAPVFLLVALAVALTSRGPILYRQQRVGKNGQTFECLKFRTMRVDADKALARLLEQDSDIRREWEATRKLEKDPRITPIGKVLRHCSLDELPQLFNVISGDMNLIGPRPIIAQELPCYGRYVQHYLSLRPGLTGMWQISGRSTTTYRRRIAADVLYARRQSAKLDLYIMFATVPAVLCGRGAV